MQPKTPLFTSDSQHPPRLGHVVYLGENTIFCLCQHPLLNFKVNSFFVVNDNFCEQFGSRSGQTKRLYLPGSIPFGTLIVFMKE